MVLFLGVNEYELWLIIESVEFMHVNRMLLFFILRVFDAFLTLESIIKKTSIENNDQFGDRKQRLKLVINF